MPYPSTTVSLGSCCRATEGGPPGAASGRLRLLLKAFENDRPAPARADHLAHLLPAFAMAVELRVDELHPGAARALGVKRHFDAARARRIGVVSEARRQMPGEREARGRRVAEH